MSLDLTGISAATRQLSPDSTSDKSTVDYDSFLTLLIATMRNQDPTQPNDPAQTLAQLAAFSNVEQGIRLNEALDRLLGVSQAGQAAALVGRVATSADGKVTGRIVGIELGDSGLVAILRGGYRLPLGAGTRIG
jgi:flagellar basal-body rod modification protein FlgD